jgi:secretion/DNA translocation related TadE-like protein
VLVLAGVMACCTIAGLWLASERAALARQRAETAADLSALAGAQALARSGPAPCGAAAVAATANGGRLIACSIAGDAVTVAVSVSSRTPAQAVARAGPQEPQ